MSRPFFRLGRLPTAIVIAALTFSIAADALPVHQAKLTASDGAAGDAFADVAVSGDTVVVGAFAADVAGHTDQGAAYVFVRTSGVWTQQAKLTADDGAANNGFGGDVAVSGDTALVGAPGRSAAYVFVRSSGVWTQQATLTADDGPGGTFGKDVALDGNTAVVGAYQASPDGAAYVFVRSGSTWSEQARLVASDPAEGDKFGEDVSVSGNTVLIGAGRSSGPNPRGAAYVFVRSGTTWSQQAKLIAADGTNLDLFGSAVSLSADTAIVGASQQDTIGAGAAYVFVRSSGVWTQQAKLTASNGVLGDGFGIRVALENNTALIGSARTVTGHDDQGAAYLFLRNGGSWSQQAEVLACDGAASDNFSAWQVALGGDTAVIGAGGDDIDGIVDRGAAYVFTGLSTTGEFTDVPLIGCPIRAVHITELRTRIDAQRVRFGLDAFGWTDTTVTAGATLIRAQHIVDLRTALSEAYVAAGRTPPSYTEVITAGITAKAAHVEELRTAVVAIE